MKITIKTPCKAYLDANPEELDRVRQELTYTNTAVGHELKRIYTNFWYKSKNPEKWQAAVEDAKRRLKATLVFQDEGGTYIRPGSIPYLSQIGIEIVSQVAYPKPKIMAWEQKLPFELHPYQEESWQELLQVRYGNVELCTGAGKSAIMLKIGRETSFRSAIIAPTKDIFKGLLRDFEKYLGRGNVGYFGDGKKKLGKRFTICISDSICNVKRGSEEWDFFSSLDCMMVDESHTFGAETLEEICHGILSNIPYRFFFSGTQTRGDGSEKLLQSIIGKTVHTLTTEQAIKGGYICYHDYRIVNIESSNPNYSTKDALDMKRHHFLKNKNICAFIAKLCNAAALASNLQTLVLVEELEQVSMLMKLLKVPAAYAHSEKKPARLLELGLEKVDPHESVDKFNKGEVKVLIGTSCVSMGTNIYPTHNTINWVGGASEIRTKQGAIGRSVRLGTHNPWASRCAPKPKATIWDFNVFDVFIMGKHLDERLSYYKDSGTEIKTINLKKQ